MRFISTAKRSSVLSLLEQGYSHHQIHDRTGVEKGTIGRIGREVDADKENNSGGRPAKLSAHDKQSILRQITSGKLDNAVQATNFINSTLSHSVHPQTVRNTMKEAFILCYEEESAYVKETTSSKAVKICTIP